MDPRHYSDVVIRRKQKEVDHHVRSVTWQWPWAAFPRLIGIDGCCAIIPVWSKLIVRRRQNLMRLVSLGEYRKVLNGVTLFVCFASRQRSPR